MLSVVKSNPPRETSSFTGDDEALVQAFRRGDEAARAELHARYARHVYRVLSRVLGADVELADLHHDVFVRALRSLPQLRDGRALKPWLTTITVHVARSAIRKRRRHRWLRFMPDDELPEREAVVAPHEARQALALTYAVLDELTPEERIVFALRYIDGMELTDVAEACTMSLATVKRRLARASKRFVAKASRHAALDEWLLEGNRWQSPNNI